MSVFVCARHFAAGTHYHTFARYDTVTLDNYSRDLYGKLPFLRHFVARNMACLLSASGRYTTAVDPPPVKRDTVSLRKSGFRRRAVSRLSRSIPAAATACLHARGSLTRAKGLLGYSSSSGVSSPVSAKRAFSTVPRSDTSMTFLSKPVSRASFLTPLSPLSLPLSSPLSFDNASKQSRSADRGFRTSFRANKCPKWDASVRRFIRPRRVASTSRLR